MTESDAAGLASLQHRLQMAVVATTKTHRGAGLQEAMAGLQRALETAYLPDQPLPWMRAAASEISSGRLLVINAREIPPELEQLEPDPDQHAAG